MFGRCAGLFTTLQWFGFSEFVLHLERGICIFFGARLKVHFHSDLKQGSKKQHADPKIRTTLFLHIYSFDALLAHFFFQCGNSLQPFRLKGSASGLEENVCAHGLKVVEGAGGGRNFSTKDAGPSRPPLEQQICIAQSWQDCYMNKAVSRMTVTYSFDALLAHFFFPMWELAAALSPSLSSTAAQIVDRITYASMDLSTNPPASNVTQSFLEGASARLLKEETLAIQLKPWNLVSCSQKISANISTLFPFNKPAAHISI